ncbi:aldehyde dehydrogenase family protein [Nocardioides sp. Iso805N]|uniref:aldehyde dehydrogenase family protein n=1 Tax=Nocardioides sp. Iso805N TaxID=1283287 RepID=UPI00056881B8|nr:aldehyde dehydrogenase family protein [Nocardioides sp. Iso805N]
MSGVTTSYRARDGVMVGRILDSSPEQTAESVDRACVAIRPLADTAPAQRRSWLDHLAAVLLDHRDELAALADAETALGMPRLTGEVERMAAQLRFYGDVAAEGSYLGVSVDTGPSLVRVNQPLGPVAVFGASNFPFAFGVLGNDTASALAAGCPVVAKAHPAHALLSERLAELALQALREAGAPNGAFGMVRGLQAGADLVRAAGVAAVGFTGSQPGGLALWRLANEREIVIPVYAEMGTVNPAVLTARGAVARATEVAEGFVASFTLGSGQFCTKPGLLLAPAGRSMPEAVGRALTALAPHSTMLTRGIADAVQMGVKELMAAGAELVTAAPGPGTGWSADAAVLRVSTAALAQGGRLHQECFGPVALVVEYDDPQDLREALAGLQGSLTGTVFTDGTDTDPDAAWLMLALAGKVGRVTVNEWPTGVAWTWAQQHGGPWPATSRPEATSVGAAALDRWVRPVAYQGVPDHWLPPAGRADNPWRVPQRRDDVG